MSCSKNNENLFHRCVFCYEKTKAPSAACDKCRNLLRIVPHETILPNKCRCISAFRYEGEYKLSVLNYKSGGKYKKLADPYSLILSKTISGLYGDIKFDCYTGVPTLKNLFKFDQVRPLAEKTAARDNVEYKELLIQTKKKKAQRLLKESERENNVRNIFKCVNNEYIQGKTILLFDDVVTTGSTLTECSNALMRSGAEKVFCVTIDW